MLRRALPLAVLLLAAGCSSGPRRGLLSSRDVPPGWSLFNTDHYQVLTDGGPEEARATAERLEGILALYRRILPSRQELPRFPVRVFRTYDAYLSYGGEDGTAGCYDQSTGDLVLTRFVGLGGGDPMVRLPSPQEMTATAYHEAWHQYFHWYLDADADPPAWFDEGMADYFGQTRIVPADHAPEGAPDAPGGGKWIFGRPNHGWGDAIRAAIADGSALPLREFVHLPRGRYYDRPAVCYPQGWSLVHFLINSRDPRTHEVPDALVRALSAGADASKAVDEAFAGMDWGKLEREWRAYVEALR
ncbi:MAG: hypothetical protein IT452_08155 [Planctomycetia bacterium]|nr:hypothetical protein [Planctomycetia bacterium]